MILNTLDVAAPQLEVFETHINQMDFTLPHYYPKYESESKTNFKVNNPFKLEKIMITVNMVNLKIVPKYKLLLKGNIICLYISCASSLLFSSSTSSFFKSTLELKRVSLNSYTYCPVVS